MFLTFYRLRYVLLLLTLTAGAFLWPGVRSALVVDNSLTVWFLEDDPALTAYRHFQQRFGNDEVVVVVVHDQRTLLTPAYFQKFLYLTKALKNLPDVAEIIGPGNAAVFEKDLFGVAAAPLLGPATKASDVRSALAGQPTLRQQLFTDDYRTARFLLVLKATPDFDQRRGDILALIRTTAEQPFRPGSVFLGGVGVIYAGLNALSRHDFGLFLLLGYVLMLGVFGWLYRKPLLIAYPVGIVAFSTYFTLGLYGALGFRLNLMTVLLPVIIVLLGVMDAIHVINERSQLHQAGLNDRESALAALRQVVKPCLYTMITTAIGFLSLQTSPMAILKNFGLFAALGILLCLFFTYLLGVLLLPLTRPSRTITIQTGHQLARFLGLILARKQLFGWVSVGLFLFFALGIAMLRTDTYTLGYFPTTHPVVQDHRSMEATWGPYMPLELLVRPKAGQSLYSPAVVRAAVAFADSVKTRPGVGRVFGFQSLYQSGLEAQFGAKSNKALGSRVALQRVHQQARRQFPQLTNQFIHAPTQTGRITVSGTMLSAGALAANIDTLMQIADATFGQLATVTPAGYQPMYAGIVNYVAASQVTSLVLSFGLVFGLVWLFMRSLKLAALTVIPNLFPVAVMLGIMGWLGIYIDTATASIGAIVLSICCDDSIHFIHQYQQNRQLGKRPDQARLATIIHVGPAIVITSVVLFAGYSLMVFGSLKTVQLWGLLTAVALAGALYGELVIFPLVLERFDREPNALS